MHCLCHFLNCCSCEVTGDEKNPPLDKGTRRNNTEARGGKEKINQKKKMIIFSPTLPSKTSWKTPHNKCRFSVSLPFFFPLRRLKSGSKCILFRLQYSACTTHSQFANIQQETWHLTMPNFD